MSAWVAAFLSGKAKAPADAAAFETELTRRLTEATQVHPVPEVRLARELGLRAPATDATAALAALHVTDVALALRAAEGAPGGMQAFERVLVDQVRLAVASLDPSPAFADEIAQQLRERLLVGESPKLLEYSGRGPLAKWLRVAALRTGLNARRGLQARTDSDDALMDMPAPGADTEVELIRGRYRTQFREAFAAAFGALSSHERNLLRLHYLDGASLVQVAQQYGLHRTTVTRQLDQARQVLFDETRRLVAEKLQLGREEFEALISVLRSQLDISIRRFLQTEA